MVGKESGFVIAEVGKAVSGKLVAAERLDEPRHFARPARHQRAFEGGHAAPVQDARRNAHHVFCRRADLRADDVVSVIETDEIALEIVRQRLFQLYVVAVDDHAVGDARREILNVAGADPYGDLVLGNARLDEDLGQAFARFHLDALHAQDKNFVRHVGGGEDLSDKPAQPLRADGNDDDLRTRYRLCEIAGENDALIQCDVLVFARIFQDFVRIVPFRSPRIHFLPLFCCEIPGDKRTPPAAAKHGYFVQT